MFLRTASNEDESRLDFIKRTNCGRASGWILEIQGKRIATLCDVRQEDQFWDSYIFNFVSLDHSLKERVYSEGFWYDTTTSKVEWRNLGNDEIVKDVIVSGAPDKSDNRIWVRGLYLRMERVKLISAIMKWIKWLKHAWR